MRKKSRRLLIGAVIIVLSAWLAWSYFKPKAIPVILYTVDYGVVEATVANTRTGTVEPCKRAQISPVTSGRVEQILVDEGERVEKGHLLLLLWNADLKAQVELLQSEEVASKAKVEESCTRADEAKRDAKRSQQIFDKGLASEDRVDEAKTTARATNAACRAAKASVDVARARVKVAKVELERSLLKAPFSGVVAENNTELGEILAPITGGPSSPLAIDLIDDSCLYVSAPIDEIDAPMVRPGMTAYVTLDAFPGKRFLAKVRRIAPYVLDIEKQARTVKVEVEFDDIASLENLLVGYSADVEIVLDKNTNTLYFPTGALLPDSEVLVYTSEGVLESRKVKTGLSNWQYTESLEGLNQGERIAVSVDREGVERGAYVVPEDEE
jgi:HlyD family secretion protein